MLHVCDAELIPSGRSLGKLFIPAAPGTGLEADAVVTSVFIAVAITFIFLGVFYSQFAYEFIWSSVLLLRWGSLGLAVILLCPTGEPINQWIHQMTGLSNLNVLVGFLLLAVGVAARVYIVLSFLGDDHVLQVKLRQVVQYPLSLAVPVLVALFMKGDTGQIGDLGDFYVGAPDNIWLILYLFVWSALILHLIGVIIRASMVLRSCRRYRRMASMVIFANWISVFAVIANILTAMSPYWAAHTGAEMLPWIAMITGCAIVSASDFFVVRHELEDLRSSEPN